jgi:hypothetical protein
VPDFVVGIGHVAGGLLVMRRDGLDAVRRRGGRIEKTDVAVTAHAEEVRHLLLDQVLDHDFRAFVLARLGLRFLRGRCGVHPDSLV